MMRRVTTILIILLVASTVGLAQSAKVGGEARQLAMGGSILGTGIVVNPYITEDPIWMLVNPAYQSKYMNYVWWNVGGGTLSNLSSGDNGYGKQSAGVNFGFGKQLSIGAIFSYDPSAVNVVNKMLSGGTALAPLPFTLPQFLPNGLRGTVGSTTVSGPQTIPAVANVWEILAAYHVGVLDLGFGFMYGNSNSDETASAGPNSASREASSSLFGFRGGLLLDLGGGSDFSAHAAVRLDKATDNVKFGPLVNGQGGEYSASGTEIELGARLKYHLNNKFNFVPYGAFLSVSGEPKEDNPRTGVAKMTNSEKLTVTGITVGVGGEYKITNFLLAGGFSYQMLSGKLEQSNAPTQTSNTSTVTYTSIPTINLGAEWWLTDWLAARGGYFRMLGKVNTKLESSVGASSSSDESNLTVPLSFAFVGGIAPSSWDGIATLGIGLRFGAFSLDGTISDEALRRGLGLLGSGDNINTFGYITLDYNFE